MCLPSRGYHQSCWRIWVLLGRLDQHDPVGLPRKREEFRRYGHRPGRHGAFAQLLEARAELVVAAKLLGAGVELVIPKDTPDFDCRIPARPFASNMPPPPPP